MKFFGFVLTMGLIFGMSQTAFAVPERVGQVNDFADALSEDVAADLESRLAQSREESGRDISILIVRNMEGMTIGEYRQSITDAWNLGDRYVLILVAVQEAVVRIAVGEALTGSYPDALLNAVINDMIPYLSDGRFDTGTTRAVNRLLDLQAPRAAEASNSLFSGTNRLLLLGALLAVSLVFFLVMSA